MDENENLTGDDALSDEAIIGDDAPIVIVNEAPKADPENGATIAQLVETIAGLNDTISGLRIQIENERNGYLDAIYNRFDDLAAKIDALRIEAAVIKPDETETGEDSTAVQTVENAVAEVARKPVRRWI